MGQHPVAAVIASQRDWWVNVYPVSHRWPLERGICHATARAAEQGRNGRASFGESKALYAVHVRLRSPLA